MSTRDNDGYKSRLAVALRESAPAFIQQIASEPGLDTGPKYAPEEIAQMMRGFYQMLDELLQDGESAVREMYMSAVFPGLRDSGLSLVGLLPGVARLLTMMAADVTPRLSPEDRRFAGIWLGDFTQSYIRDIVELWGQRTS